MTNPTFIGAWTTLSAVMFVVGARDFRDDLHASPTLCLVLVIGTSIVALALVVLSSLLSDQSVKHRIRRIALGCALTSAMVFGVGWVLRDETAEALAQQMDRIQGDLDSLKRKIAEGQVKWDDYESLLRSAKELEGRQTRVSEFIDFGNVYRYDRWMTDFEESIGIVCAESQRFCEASIRSGHGLSVTWQAPVGPIVMNFSRPLPDTEGHEPPVMKFTFGTEF